MTKFDRYVLTQLVLLFGFFALVLVSVYWINRAVILFDQLIADGQSAGTFLALTLLTLPNVIRLVLPIAAFVAAVYVINRLTTDSELVIAQSSGMSPWRLSRPLIGFGVVTTLLMGLLVHILVPQSRIALAERQAEIEANITSRMLVVGRFIHPADGVTFYIREITNDGTLRGVFLSDARNPDSRTTYTAAEGVLLRDEETGDPALLMFDGTAQTYDPLTGQLSTTLFERSSYDVAALTGETGRGRRDVREYSTPMLFAPTPEALAATRKSPSDFFYEGHLRIVQPFTPAIAALLGFAALQLGSFSRFGIWRQIGLAVVLIILVQVGENAVADAARRDAALWPLIYAPFAGGLAAAFVLLWIASRPSWDWGSKRDAAPPSGGGVPG